MCVCITFRLFYCWVPCALPLLSWRPRSRRLLALLLLAVLPRSRPNDIIRDFMVFMSISSSAESMRRNEIYYELRHDLAQLGVPHEAWPRRPPRCYGSYHVRGPHPERNPINVLPLVRRFLVPAQVQGWHPSTYIDWGDDPAGAWRYAKELARW